MKWGEVEKNGSDAKTCAVRRAEVCAEKLRRCSNSCGVLQTEIRIVSFRYKYGSLRYKNSADAENCADAEQRAKPFPALRADGLQKNGTDAVHRADVRAEPCAVVRADEYAERGAVDYTVILAGTVAERRKLQQRVSEYKI